MADAVDGWTVTVRERARALLRREAGPCWICGLPIDYSLRTPDPGSFEVDHKIPRDKAPELSTARSNWAPAHRRCNRAKSNKEFAPIIKRSGSLK